MTSASAPSGAVATPLRLALFDLDHTLLPFDSDFSWGQFTTALGWTDAEEFKRQNETFYAQYQAGTLDIRAYCRFATAAVRRQGPQAEAQAHARFMQDVVLPGITAQALELVRGHQAQGDTVLIITATNEFVTRPIAQAFGVEELLAIELERDETPGGSAWYTGEIRGIPSFREGKVLRMDAWLAARGLDWSRVHSTFYSDSINDLPLLEKVTVPVATNPDARLLALAGQRGWRILQLFA